MATSAHLGLKIWDENDPFLLVDFNSNSSLADAYPGNWICTSTTRPAWTSARAGMCITETDTRRTMLWTGTTWKEMLYGPAIWWGSTRPGVMVSKGTKLTYVVGTFTVNRPGTLFGIINTEIDTPGRGAVTANLRCAIDGSQANWDGASFGEHIGADWDTSPSSSALNKFSNTVTSLGVRNISAGTHSIGALIQTGGGNDTQVRITSIRAVAMFTNGTDR